MKPPLDGRNVLVGVCGGIASYKVAEVVRLLVTAGARVQVMMTRAAQEFVTPLTFQALTGQPVATETFDLTQESQIGHIRLADSADVVLVAPATANIIGKMAAGIGDDLVTTVLLATRAPVLLAPSMNVNMYENPVVQANLRSLRALGHRVIQPGTGFLACGWHGTGRLADPADIVAEVERALSPQDLAGERVLVTAGPNREPLDPVRFVSNRSTGKMGFALAAAAWRRGAAVDLVAGPTGLPTPTGVSRIDVETAAEMHAAVLAAFETATIVIMAAAVADYRAAAVAPAKLKKGPERLTLDLVRTVDILTDIAPRKGDRLLVGFAAETEDVEANAARKLRAKGLDLIVANDVTGTDRGFAADTNAVTILDAGGGREEVPLMSKDAVAGRILDRIVALRALPRG